MKEMQMQAQQRLGERGQAIAEFAIVIPMLFLLIVGLIDVGRMVYINNAIAQGAREGARFGAVQGRSSTSAGLISVADEVKGRMTAVPNPTASVTCDRMIMTTTDCGAGDVINVRVDTSVSPMTPIIGDLIGPLSFSAVARITVHG
jgi:Flp pilus assembly protein TadG